MSPGKEEAAMTRMMLLTLALLLTGCGGPTYWTKPGAQPGEFAKDKSECEVELELIRMWRPAGTTDGVAYVLVHRGRHQLEHCLKAKGWQQIEQPSEEPSAD